MDCINEENMDCTIEENTTPPECVSDGLRSGYDVGKTAGIVVGSAIGLGVGFTFGSALGFIAVLLLKR